MVLETLYGGFIELSYFLIILVVSVVATVITTLIYKFTTNQDKLKKTKEEVKKLREKMNEYKTDQKKLMEVQKQMMSKNMEMMKASFRPMIYTFIPLILLFSWMSGALAFEPLMPGEPFTVTATLSDTYASGLDKISITSIPESEILKDDDFVPEKEGSKQVRWVVSPPKEGTFQLLFESPTFKQTKEVIVSKSKTYSNPVSEFEDSQLTSVVVGNNPVRPFKGIPVLKGLNWLWTYILLSVVTSIAFRKILKVA